MRVFYLFVDGGCLRRVRDVKILTHAFFFRDVISFFINLYNLFRFNKAKLTPFVLIYLRIFRLSIWYECECQFIRRYFRSKIKY
jgi:hypothetical protein